MRLKRMLVAVVVLLTSGMMMAQQMPDIPTDPNVKIGHLDNGLTYYLRHNALPEGVASFYIAQKVGSINEEESQRGLAHLLEHLAFNGSDHFKGNNLQEYLQSIGVEYGRNLNAYTSTDETVYYFTDVPTKRATAVDSCMLILKDWSNGITLTQEAIDGERDVVHNEYRMRMVGQMRIFERALPALYPGSKYGVRMPIGLMSVIDGCNPDVLRAYYKKWYRTDNQAIIVVGDIDVDKIEAKIKELFSGIKVPADAAKVIPEPVPNTKDAIYVVDKDKEMPADVIMVSMKHDATPKEQKKSMMYLIQGYAENVIANMLSDRFQDKAQDPNCPYLSVNVDISNYLVSKTEDALQLEIVPKPGKDVEAYAAALTEAKRVEDFGFTATEYLRAQEEFMSKQEKAYTNRDKMKNEEFTGQYVRNFEDAEPIPSVEQVYQIYQQIVPSIPIDMINMAAKEYININDSNFVCLAMLQEKDGVTYPTTQQFADAKAKVIATKLEAYVDNVKQEPLVAQTPKAGTVTKTTENTSLGYKEMTLSNGAKVILKKTDYKDNEIIFSAWAKGGYSSYPESKAVEIAFLGQAASASGLGNFSNIELKKATAGKQVSVGLSIDNYERNISGKSTPKDIETLMQLIYLNMTNVAKDEKSFENMRNQMIAVLSNMSNNPNLVYQDSLSSTLNCGNKFERIPTADEVKTVDYDYMLSQIKALYSNAGDFTFMFVGNIDEQKLLPLINTYIGSLPGKGKAVQNKQMPRFKGDVKNDFTKKMENPQNQCHEVWDSKPMENTLKNRVLVDIAGRVLDMTYNRNIREKLSAAYHAGADGSFERMADDKMIYTIDGIAMLNPDKSDEAVPYFFSGMKETIANPSAEDLQKVKEILLKQADVDAKTNNHWIGVISKYLKYGVDFQTDYKATVSAVDGKAVSDFLKNVIMSSGNHAEILMKAVKN